jgi:hypothetical protein
MEEHCEGGQNPSRAVMSRKKKEKYVVHTVITVL